MPDVYTVTPQPVAGQQGSPLIRWLDRYAQAHAAAVAQIDEAVDGDTVTTTNFAMVVTLMARLGVTRGLRCVPLAMANAVTITRALVLEKALVPLHTKALIGDEAVDVPQTGQTSPLRGRVAGLAGHGVARLSRPAGSRAVGGPRWPGRPPAQEAAGGTTLGLSPRCRPWPHQMAAAPAIGIATTGGSQHGAAGGVSAPFSLPSPVPVMVRWGPEVVGWGTPRPVLSQVFIWDALGV